MTEIVENQLEIEDSNSESSRKLAVVTSIKNLLPIAGADRIEIVTFTSNFILHNKEYG